MQTRKLPDGRSISRLGFGASSYWAKREFPESQAISVAVGAMEMGIRYFDTGPSYAAGIAEERLGKALRMYDGPPPIVSTKFGTHAAADGSLSKSFDPKLLAQSVQGSLKRLGRERIDLLFLHGPAKSDLTDQLLEAVGQLKQAGDILWVGICSWDHDVLEHASGPVFDAAMLQYNVMDRASLNIARKLSVQGKMVFNATTLAQGMFKLSNFLPTDRRSAWYLLRMLKNDPAFLAKSLAFQIACRKAGSSPHAAAIQFVLDEPAFTSAVFGSTRIANVQANVAAAEDAYG